MATVRDRFHEALALHQSGRGDEAEPVYRELLRNDPAHAYEHLLRQTSESWYDDLDDQTANLTYTTTYNDLGQVASIGDGATEYEYTDQLTGADYDFQTDESYSYDENGNRTNTGYATGDHNRLTSDGTYNYTYDGEGNVSSKTKISDSTSIQYTWDHRNRLTKVTFKNSAGTATKIVEYCYDNGQRWIRKTLDTNADGTIDESQIFVHDQDQIVLDFRKTGAEAATTLDLARRYLWGPAVDQLLADETVDDGTADDVAWVLGDHLNSVRDLAVYDPVTQMVSVVKHVTFDAFGNVTSDSAPGVKVLFLYTARPFDPDSALQNNGFRWLELPTGRWMSADPIGFESGDVNLYRYVGNSVTIAIDPLAQFATFGYPIVSISVDTDYVEFNDHQVTHDLFSVTRWDMSGWVRVDTVTMHAVIFDRTWSDCNPDYQGDVLPVPFEYKFGFETIHELHGTLSGSLLTRWFHDVLADKYPEATNVLDPESVDPWDGLDGSQPAFQQRRPELIKTTVRLIVPPCCDTRLMVIQPITWSKLQGEASMSRTTRARLSNYWSSSQHIKTTRQTAEWVNYAIPNVRRIYTQSDKASACV